MDHNQHQTRYRQLTSTLQTNARRAMATSYKLHIGTKNYDLWGHKQQDDKLQAMSHKLERIGHKLQAL